MIQPVFRVDNLRHASDANEEDQQPEAHGPHMAHHQIYVSSKLRMFAILFSL